LIGARANTGEITPIIAGVAFAAQVGAGFTAELGAMRISDEIDALEVMSVPTFVYLVCTRVVAGLLAIIPLYLISLYASYGATYLVTTRFFGLSQGVYNHYFHLYLPFIDVIYSLAKACVFAVAVTLIHCYYGFYASGGPEGVGVAVGRAIRLSIVTVVVLNLILSLVFWGGGNTVRVAGQSMNERTVRVMTGLITLVCSASLVVFGVLVGAGTRAAKYHIAGTFSAACQRR